MKRGKFRSRRGFTLFELLVSLALLGLIMVFVASSLRFGTRAWERAEGEASVSDIASIRRFLERTISDARVIEQVRPDGRLQLAFEGQADRLAFIAVSQGYTEIGGLYRYDLSLEPGRDGGQALFVTQALYRPEGPVAATARKRLLLDGVTGFRLRYFGPTNTGANQWSPAWTSTAGLPHLIAIDVQFAPSDPRRWPEQVLRITAATP